MEDDISCRLMSVAGVRCACTATVSSGAGDNAVVEEVPALEDDDGV